MIDEEDKQTLPFKVLEQRAAVAETKAITAEKKLKDEFAKIIRIALGVLSQKARVIYSMTLMAALYVFSMVEPSILRVSAAFLFSLCLIHAGMFKDGEGQ